MNVAIGFAVAFACFAVAMHLVSIVVVGLQCRRAREPATPAATPAITILRPVRGVDHAAEATLRSTFELDWPDYEVIFCSATETDPVVPLVERLIAEYPHIPARLLSGDDRISINPKLNNLVKGWQAAAHQWIVMSDSNVLLPPDFLKRLMVRWTPSTGLVCSPPVGGEPDGFAAQLECAFLNTFEARWQNAAGAVGMGFAQGKTMLWHRELLDRAGGVAALARETAEDAAATKVVRGAGLSVRLDPGPFIQPLGRRDLRAVWNRQVRWARLRRASFKLFFLPELVSGGFAPLAAVAFLVGTETLPLVAFLGLAAVWYGAEFVLARLAGWHFSTQSVPALLLRDLLIPPLWILAWTGNGFNWRGNAMQIERASTRITLAGIANLVGKAARPIHPLNRRGMLPASLSRKLRTKTGRSGH
jgi:ceramide glucosyltransferase